MPATLESREHGGRREEDKRRANISQHRYNADLYERIRVLGKGSFGTAILHRRQADGLLVVLKEIDLQKLKQDADKLAMVSQEARIMSKLSHANIIQYHSAYTTSDSSKLIIEMEYARIGTLQGYLSLQTRPLAELEILTIFRQILAGLEYLHSKSIVHLDLKMANIFLTSEGRVKIGDFGIARLVSRPDQRQQQQQPRESLREGAPGEQSSSVRPRLASVGARASTSNSHYCQLGTLAYSSPERCQGGPTGFKSDIWSLGCLLYELAELRPLFPARSLAKLVMSITQVRFEPMRRLDLQPGVRNLFMLMMARQPQDRPSARELVGITDNLLARHHERRGSHDQANSELECTGQQEQQPQQQSGPNQGQPASSPSLRPPRTQPATISYPHSLVYQVKLSSRDVQVDCVHLPQSKRVREMAKGRSHYLVLTYDHIVYGWGTRHCGQLGSCSSSSSSSSAPAAGNLLASHRRSPGPRGGPRHTSSARNSLTARDLPEALLEGARLRAPTFACAARPLSLTQPSSLASSTQTLTMLAPAPVGAAGEPARPPPGRESRPLASSRPFIVGELNKRKIVRLAAGNDFSVFLSKTGIVMTCGDGSRGCLGRGNLASSHTPCMVDSLLSMDMVGVACGPEHVAAVSANGQAFVWGNSRHGRLGLARERLEPREGLERLDHLRGHLVVLPQRVEFCQDERLGRRHQEKGQEVFIKSAYCGDRCTIFVDSQHNCWACGENKFNRLGLDVKRRFKRTLLVELAWLPLRISALSKHKVVSCQVGAKHASYLTSEGKLLVCGQDIDLSYKLRSDLSACSGRQSRQGELHLARMISHGHHQLAPTRELVSRLLASNQLANFKAHNSTAERGESPASKWSPKLTRKQRRLVERYLRLSRACKKMPFDRVLSASCTSKFTLALTSDNRVYFWGARTHDKGHSPPPDLHLSPANSRMSIEPALAASSPTECFIKIGATNNSLMSSIQLLGSDQPILHARNPQLRAASLADLWILDYKPPAEDSSSCSSSRRSSRSSSTSCSCSCSCSLASLELSDSISCASSRSHSSQPTRCDGSSQRGHHAILEPQPIVSLYVPPTFAYNNSLTQLVQLFSFDEDRFFLVLDTTVQLASPAATQSSRPNSRRGSLSLKHPAAVAQVHSPSVASNQHQAIASLQVGLSSPGVRATPVARLNIVEESKSSGSSSRDQQVAENRHSGTSAQRDHPLECCRRLAPDGMRREQQHEKEDLHSLGGAQAPPSSASGAEGPSSVSLQPSAGAHTGLSLEEPRSMSTFAPLSNFGAQHHLILSADASPENENENDGHEDLEEEEDDDQAPVMRKLSFERSGHSHSFAPANYLLRRKRGRQKRAPLNRSESTAVTLDGDETSSMPTWVRNEYLQQLSSGASSPLSGSDQSGEQSEQGEAEEMRESELEAASEVTLTKEPREPQGEKLEVQQVGLAQEDGDCDAREVFDWPSSFVTGLANRSVVAPHAEQPRPQLDGRRSSSPAAQPPAGCSAESVRQTLDGRADDEILRDSRADRVERHKPMSRSQSDISHATGDRWRRRAHELAHTSGALDSSLAGGSRMARNLLECSVYKRAMGTQEAFSSRCSSNPSRASEDTDSELQNFPASNSDESGAQVPSVDCVDSREVNRDNLLLPPDGSSEHARGLRVAGQRSLSHSAVCLPAARGRYAARLSFEPAAGEANTGRDANNNPSKPVNANKSTSCSSLTSIRRSLVRMFC